MKRRRSPAKKAAPRVYTVYVIQLSRDCVKEPCVLAPLYVGQTAHSPAHRFAQHKAGGRLAASKPHQFGEKLRWDLMAKIGPLSNRKDAEAAEKAMAEALERRGHRVFWG